MGDRTNGGKNETKNEKVSFGGKSLHSLLMVNDIEVKTQLKSMGTKGQSSLGNSPPKGTPIMVGSISLMGVQYEILIGEAGDLFPGHNPKPAVVTKDHVVTHRGVEEGLKKLTKSLNSAGEPLFDKWLMERYLSDTGDHGPGPSPQLVEIQAMLFQWGMSAGVDHVNEASALLKKAFKKGGKPQVYSMDRNLALESALKEFKCTAEYWRLIALDCVEGKYQGGKYRSQAEQNVKAGTEFKGRGGWKVKAPVKQPFRKRVKKNVREYEGTWKSVAAGKVPEDVQAWEREDLAVFGAFIETAISDIDHFSEGRWTLYSQPKRKGLSKGVLVRDGSIYAQQIADLDIYKKSNTGDYFTANLTRWYTQASSVISLINDVTHFSSVKNVAATNLNDYEEAKAAAYGEVRRGIREDEREAALLSSPPLPGNGQYNSQISYKVPDIAFFSGVSDDGALVARIKALKAVSKDYGIKAVQESTPIVVTDSSGKQAIITARKEGLFVVRTSDKHAFLDSLYRMGAYGTPVVKKGVTKAQKQFDCPNWEQWPTHRWPMFRPKIFISSGLQAALEKLPTKILGKKTVAVGKIEKELVAPVSNLIKALAACRAALKGLPMDDNDRQYDALLEKMERSIRSIKDARDHSLFVSVAVYAVENRKKDDEAYEKIGEDYKVLKRAMQLWKAKKKLLEDKAKEAKPEDAEAIKVLSTAESDAFEDLNDKMEIFICSVRDNIAVGDNALNIYLGYKERFKDTKALTYLTPDYKPSLTIEEYFRDVVTVQADKRKKEINEMLEVLEELPQIATEIAKVNSLPLVEKIMYPAFIHTLMDQMAWENSLFFMDLQDPGKSNYYIYKQYVPDSAEFSFNVSYNTRHEIETAFGNAIRVSEDRNADPLERREARDLLSSSDRTLFKDAEKEVMQLIANLWVRFYKSEGKKAVFASLVTRRR